MKNYDKSRILTISEGFLEAPNTRLSRDGAPESLRRPRGEVEVGRLELGVDHAVVPGLLHRGAPGLADHVGVRGRDEVTPDLPDASTTGAEGE